MSKEMIYREVTVTERSVTQPVHYVQGSTILPIVIHLRDFDLDSSMSAVYAVYKPNKTYELGNCMVGYEEDNNVIVVTPSASTFEVCGLNKLQIKMVKDSLVLVTFEIPVCVYNNYTLAEGEPGHDKRDIFGGVSFEKLTKDQYEALDPKNPSTEYFVTDSEGNTELYFGDKPVSGGGGETLSLDQTILSLVNGKGEKTSSVDLSPLMVPCSYGVSITDNPLEKGMVNTTTDNVPVTEFMGRYPMRDDSGEDTEFVVSGELSYSGDIILAVIHRGAITLPDGFEIIPLPDKDSGQKTTDWSKWIGCTKDGVKQYMTIAHKLILPDEFTELPWHDGYEGDLKRYAVIIKQDDALPIEAHLFSVYKEDSDGFYDRTVSASRLPLINGESDITNGLLDIPNFTVLTLCHSFDINNEPEFVTFDFLYEGENIRSNKYCSSYPIYTQWTRLSAFAMHEQHYIQTAGKTYIAKRQVVDSDDSESEVIRVSVY